MLGHKWAAPPQLFSLPEKKDLVCPDIYKRLMQDAKNTRKSNTIQSHSAKCEPARFLGHSAEEDTTHDTDIHYYATSDCDEHMSERVKVKKPDSSGNSLPRESFLNLFVFC